LHQFKRKQKIVDEGKSMYPLVESLENEVYYITFQRPERKNALNQNLTTGLLNSLNQAEEKKQK
jgi:enoyl-CoA hydratase/carnithine racemase